MIFEKKAELDYKPRIFDREATADTSYTRTIFNNTGIDVVVLDSAGCSTLVVAEYNSRLPNFPHDDKHVLLEEWFEGTDHLAIGGLDIQKLLEEEKAKPYHCQRRATGVTIRTRINFLDFVLNSFLYHEASGLVFRTSAGADLERMKKPMELLRGHPRFDSNIKNKLYNFCAFTLAIEVADPKYKFDKLYYNHYGKVYAVIPKRGIGIRDEGVFIHTRSSEHSAFDTSTYEFDDLLDGDGVNGIRLYTSHFDAQLDVRDPEKTALQKEIMDLRKIKKTLGEEYYNKGRDDTLAEAEKILQSGKEKLRRAEDIVEKHHEAKRNEKLGFWSYIAKAVNSLFSFIKSIFI